MQGFETRFERLELKFVIDETTAQRTRRDLEPYCHADEHSHSNPGAGPAGYLLRSLYLDTPSLEFYRAKARGDAERIKLRVRKYEGVSRAMVLPSGIEDVIRGRAKLWEETPEGRRFVEHFGYLLASTGAQPKLLIRYMREAYASSVDCYARVTMDRNISAQRVGTWDFDGDPDAWCDVAHFLAPGTPKPLVVLELKCRSRVPHWITDIIRHNDLRTQSFSKYSIGIHITGRVLGSASAPRRCGRILR
jgi:hypothetical protein